MKTIWFTDFWDSWYFGKDEIWNQELLDKYNLELNEFAPDILVYSVFGGNHQKYRPKVSILFSGENLERPQIHPYFKQKAQNLGKSEYAIIENAYDHPNIFWLSNGVEKFGFDYLTNKLSIENRTNYLPNKTKFCYFMVRNGECQYRGDYFDYLNSNYKKVDSLGSYKNNTGINLTGEHEEMIKYLSQYKFALCFENSSSPGYCTEKIVQAYLAGCIPVYWGDPEIANYFDPGSMVYVNNFEEATQRIIEIDSNPELYNKIVSKNIFSSNKFLNKEGYYSFLDKIIKG